MIVFERKYPVNVFDTDYTGLLNLKSLFDYFQDLAGRHASILGFGREHLMNNGNIWVLSRITAEIDKMPSLWEEVTVRTWPRGTDAIFALRDFEMFDQEGKKIAGASSSWVVVDYSTRKVQRPDRALAHLNTSFPVARALSANAGKVPAVPLINQEIKELTVTSSDIDVNFHVNNATYIGWVCNCYDPGFVKAHLPGTIEVNYLSEGLPGDRINIITGPEDQGTDTYIHSVVRQDDNTELCRIRIKWREEKV
jgi:medium-chain acyl-[acyl-carrier-protein] hydrolase